MKKIISSPLLIVWVGTIGFSTMMKAGIGDWKNYTDMTNVVGLAAARSAVWIGTSGGILRYTQADSSFQKFTNSEGLTGNDVSAVGIDSYGSVWVGETSGEIDVYSPSSNTWKNISDIALSLQTQKAVNAFAASGDTMYLCTAFGVSVFSVSKFEFGDTYGNFGVLSHPNVTCLTAVGGTIYVGTSNGIAVSKPGARNLADPQSWTSYTSLSGITAIASFHGNVYAASGAGVYEFENGGWQSVPGTPQPAEALVTIDSSLYAAGSGNVVVLSPSNAVTAVVNAAPAAITCAIADSAKRFIAGFQEAGIGILSIGTAQWAQLIVNSPASNLFNSIAVDDNGTVWGASAGPGGTNGKGFFSFDGTRWRNYNLGTMPQLETNQFFSVSIGPHNSKWLGSWGGSLAVMDDAGNLVRVFDNRNPGFVGVDPQHPGYIVMGSAGYDNAGSMWVPDYLTLDGNVLWEMKTDSSWVSVRAPQSTSFNHALGVFIDRNGTKWVKNSLLGFEPLPSHCIYYNESGGIAGLASDGWGEVSVSDGLASAEVTCVVEDKEGSLWLGSNLGISVIGDPAYPTSQISILYLGAVEGQFINTIAVDALNNKWVAMQSGVAVLSPDGSSLITQYSVANTNGKLVDNNVLSIAFDDKRGIVYFGTNKGLSSLEIPSIGTVEKMSSLQVGPNPFILPDHPTVTIKGLADNTTIKILNVTGALVKEFPAQGGGRAFWDGTDSRGNNVGSGVYIIVAYADNGNQVSTAKVALLRR